MVVGKREILGCKKRHVKIKQVQKSAWSVTDDGNYDKEIQRRIETVKVAFPKLSNVLRDKIISLETKTRKIEITRTLILSIRKRWNT